MTSGDHPLASSRYRVALSMIVLCCAANASSKALAFCRERVGAGSEAPCDPNSPELPLFWDRSCVTYTFNENVFARLSPMSESEVRTAFRRAYETWAAVDCGRRERPFLVAQASDVTRTTTAEFRFDAPNESIVVHRSRAEWLAETDHDLHAVALTKLFFDTHTGEILDVDMELNGAAGRFADCEVQSCTDSMVDLQNTITHEAGHLLGLGHSMVLGSTLDKTTTSSQETSKRSLEDDDERGYCALDLPPGPACSSATCTCPAASVFASKRASSTGGCAIVRLSARSGGSIWLALSSVWVWSACRRSSRRMSIRWMARPAGKLGSE